MSRYAHWLERSASLPDTHQRAASAHPCDENLSEQIRTTMSPLGESAEATLLSYVLDAPSFDPIDGPTHQPGVAPGPHYEPLRTPFGEVSIPGALLERNVTDLDLVKNRHKPDERFRP